MTNENPKSNVGDSTSASMDATWTINQLDHLLDVYHDQLNANKEKFNK